MKIVRPHPYGKRKNGQYTLVGPNGITHVSGRRAKRLVALKLHSTEARLGRKHPAVLEFTPSREGCPNKNLAGFDTGEILTDS
jgi:hypothetical protein